MTLLDAKVYDPAPARVQQALAAAWKPRVEED